MARLVLKTDILDKIRKDAVLFGEIGKCLPKKIGVRGLLEKTYENDQILTSASVLNVLRDNLKVSDKELLQEVAA